MSVRRGDQGAGRTISAERWQRCSTVIGARWAAAFDRDSPAVALGGGTKRAQRAVAGGWRRSAQRIWARREAAGRESGAVRRKRAARWGEGCRKAAAGPPAPARP